MRIVPQAAPNSHSLFPPPLLMLPAPRIAGLLPARVAVTSGEPPPAPDLSIFTYTHPGLAELPTAQREKLLNGAKVLLDVALDFALNGLAEDALRAAEVLFHRAAGGQPPKHFKSPKEFSIDHQSKLMEIMIAVSNVPVITREQAERELDEQLRLYHEAHPNG